MKVKYILEDISNLSHRVFHSTKSKLGLTENDDLEQHRGLFIHNIMNTIEQDRQKFNSPMDKTILCFDSHSWRMDFLSNHELMDASDYKDGRDQSQKLFIRSLIETIFYITSQMNYIVLKENNFEADDLIALFIKTNVDENTEFLIISNDDDFTQLKQYNTQIFSPNKKQFNEKHFSTVESKIIKGDESDNIKKIIPTYYINGKEIRINFSVTEIETLISENFNESEYIRETFKLIVADRLSEKLLKKGFDNLKEQLKSDTLKGRELTSETNNQFHDVFTVSNNFTTNSIEETKEEIKSQILNKYNLNEVLIDFDYIPDNLVREFNNFDFSVNNYNLDVMKKTLECFELTELSKKLKG